MSALWRISCRDSRKVLPIGELMLETVRITAQRIGVWQITLRLPYNCIKVILGK